MDNMDVMVYDNLDETITEIFHFLFSIYQISLETQMTGIDFIFDCVNLLYYKCKKINFKRGGSCIDSPDQIRKKEQKEYTQKTVMINDFNMQQQLNHKNN